MKILHQSSAVTVYQSALFQTNATVIVGDSYVMVIDPNWLPDEVEFLYAAAEAAAGKEKQRYLLFTHSDYDHIIGYERFEGYTTIASQNFVDNPHKEKTLAQIQTFDDEYYIQRTYPITYPTIEQSISEEGQELKIGEDTYLFYQARGHNADGLITYNCSKNILIAGDYLCAVEFPYLYDSLAEYRKTLIKFDNLLETEQAALLIPGHGAITERPAVMMSRLTDSRAYLDALEESIRGDKVFDLKSLFVRYEFPQIMTKFHEANVTLVRKELGL